MYVDLAKAYDSVDRGRLWRVFLDDLGLSRDLVCSLQRMYTDFQVQIVGKGPTPPPLAVRIGAKQGCPCSPSIFTAFFDRVYWEIEEKVGRDRGTSGQLIRLLST